MDYRAGRADLAAAFRWALQTGKPLRVLSEEMPRKPPWRWQGIRRRRADILAS